MIIRNKMEFIRRIAILSICIVALLGCQSTRKETSLVIELESNPTTGYSWQYSITGTGELEEIKHEYIPNSSLLGSGGIEVFTFAPKSKGSIDIAFSYVRAWESPSIAPVKEISYSYTIDSSLMIGPAPKL